MGKLQKRQ